ncbi:hypothetical protein GGR54DRAFT_620545 [Hypoxylon sp. NC1633]|nr:hypothetical protein GGR54DRAFT_620545 [Hypoxylon sp. NC1633]
MDDPWDWNIDRVVRELCSSDRTWTPSSNTPNLPDFLEASLREQEADGYTILTYSDESELFCALGIKSLKHKSTFRDARNQLRERSRKYKLDLIKSIDDSSTARTIAASSRKQRRIAPTAVSEEDDINVAQFLSHHGPNIITHPYQLDTSAGIDPLQEDPISDLELYDSDDDPILPLYGDSNSDEEYDSETWEEIQEEQKEKIASGTHLLKFDPEAIMDEAIQIFVSDWEQHKLPRLLPRANKLWVDARKRNPIAAINKIRNTVQLYETRLGKLREGILCQQWSDEVELRSVIPALKHTVLDMHFASWQLDIVSSPQEPDKLSPSQSVSSYISKPRRSRLDNRVDEEMLTSESEGDRDDFIVNSVRDKPRPYLG